MDSNVKVFPHVRPHTALVCHINRYWHSSVSSMNSGMPTPAEGLQWNMMVDDTVLLFTRPHCDSEGTIKSRFPPDGKAEKHSYLVLIVGKQESYLTLN